MSPLEPPHFYRAYASYVHSTLRRLGVRPADIDDLTQEVFIRAFKRAGGYDDTRPVRPWLFGLAYRVASENKRSLRRRGEQIPLSEEAELPDSADGPEERAQTRQSQALVLAALERIPIKQRAVIVMHEIDGESVTAIAEALEITLNTAYSRLRLGRAQFARAVNRLTDASRADPKRLERQSKTPEAPREPPAETNVTPKPPKPRSS